MPYKRRAVWRALCLASFNVVRAGAVIDSRISIATVYRTVRPFEEASILERHDFGDGRARYEEATDDHHDHLINVQSGEVIEFQNGEIEVLRENINCDYGMRLAGHRLELYGLPLDGSNQDKSEKD